MKCGKPRRFPSTKADAPSGRGTTCRLDSRCAFHRPTEPPRRRLHHSGGNRHAAWNRAEKPKSPERNELEAALGELVVSRSGLVTAGTNRFRPLARPHRDFDTLVIGAEAGLLINETRKTMTTV